MIQCIFFAISLLLVAFGQPAWCSGCGLIAAAVGYALFWKALNEIQRKKYRFWVAFLWFALVQMVQLSWFVAHPYFYIWIIYFGLSFAIGAQFGLLSLLVRPSQLEKYWKLFGIAGLWVLFEWSRLWVLSGFSWNPVGLALSGSLYSLQLSSLMGIYGLSFWVILTNLTALRAFYKYPSKVPVLLWAFLTLFPYLFGWAQVSYHDSRIKSTPPKQLTALLVQTAFPIEECLSCPLAELKTYVLGEWRQILRALRPFKGEKIDLIVLPEYVVPYGTWSPEFKWSQWQEIISDMWGADSLLLLPPLEEPLASKRGGEWKVTNAFILQGLSNLFQAQVIAGLEDAEWVDEQVEYYNAALVFDPWKKISSNRYEKRVLVPMGEYIPFEFCREWAKSYGVGGSFTAGRSAKVFKGEHKVPFGLSICYEETYGHLMRENRLEGAELLVNLTSDVWYPNSRLPQQHLDHARLRATEGGVPLLRSCNTGVTCAIDALGRTVATFGNDEWKQGALKAELPLYSYYTPYTSYGDTLIVGISSLMGALLFLRRKN